MLKNDTVCLMHMLDAAREACSFVEGRKRNNLDRDRRLVLALVKSIEIIGEAAARVSKEYREITPQIPWQNIIGMRNRLIYAYFDINLDILWETVIDDLPPLIAEVKKIISSA